MSFLRSTHDLSGALDELRRAPSSRPGDPDEIRLASAAIAFTAQLAIELGCTATEIRSLEAMLIGKLREPATIETLPPRAIGLLVRHPCRHCGLATPAEPYSEANPIVRICARRVDSDGSHLPCVYGPDRALGVRKPDESP
jgi:hypothetical protein